MYFGWTSFTFNKAQNASWSPSDNKPISKLRFKDCIFTVGSTSEDVTSVLNNMAQAYSDSTVAKNPSSLMLDRPLNSFSFTIVGFNDSNTVSLANKSKSPWCSAPAARCNVDSDCSTPAVPGMCSRNIVNKGATCSPNCSDGETCMNGECIPRGYCAVCSGAPECSLTGYYKTI